MSIAITLILTLSILKMDQCEYGVEEYMILNECSGLIPYHINTSEAIVQFLKLYVWCSSCEKMTTPKFLVIEMFSITQHSCFVVSNIWWFIMNNMILCKVKRYYFWKHLSLNHVSNYFYCYLLKRERGKRERNRDNQKELWFAGSLPKSPEWPVLGRAKAGTESSIQVSHEGSRSITVWVITSVSQRLHWQKVGIGSLNWDWNPGNLTWNMGILTGIQFARYKPVSIQQFNPINPHLTLH